MNTQLIQGISIDWNKVDEHSYLRNVEAIKGLERLPQSRLGVFLESGELFLLGIPDAEILSVDDGLIHKCEYEETDSYQVTEMFINNRKQLLERMLIQQELE